jgi:hypothetical protein
MLIHVVCFKYGPKIGEVARREHRARLRALGSAGIGGVLEVKVGADVVHSARSYDTALIVRFTDRAALDAYQTDPRHVPVAQFGAGLCESIVAVDFDD